MQRLQWCMYWFWCFEKTQKMHTGEKPHLTVFAGNFPVRIHVCLQLHPSFACHFTILTSEHMVIMLWLNVHPQMFVRRSFNAAYGTGRHGDCRMPAGWRNMWTVPKNLHMPAGNVTGIYWIFSPGHLGRFYCKCNIWTCFVIKGENLWMVVHCGGFSWEIQLPEWFLLLPLIIWNQKTVVMVFSRC